MERHLEGVSDRWLVYVGVGLLLLIALLFARLDVKDSGAQSHPEIVIGRAAD